MARSRAIRPYPRFSPLTDHGNPQLGSPTDPLVLDGNGITTSAINPNVPLLFDMDGGSTKTGTGWIAAGEAFVVRDLNANGTIDSGRELFGDSTVLTQGPRAGQTAAYGFEALADLDSNADGQCNASDAALARVKLWKDLNQDGISQSGELFTFAQLGVASIKVADAASNINLGGGNTQALPEMHGGRVGIQWCLCQEAQSQLAGVVAS